MTALVSDWRVGQHSSHSHLVEDAAGAPSPLPGARSARFDAIVVPASRGVGVLAHAMTLAKHLDTRLVALCSKGTQVDNVIRRAEITNGPVTIAVQVPTGYHHPVLPARTTAEAFQRAGAGRRSDLSLKRNLGILLARLHGWTKILFVDDDIGAVSADPGEAIRTARRLATQLERHQIAGLVCRDFPDNSVYCHARRLAGFRQDNFVSGAALGLNCVDHPIPFFPDIYNEDWFFFAQRAANRELAQVGEARQAVYDPFADPRRGAQEEFGDLLAEGLYALFDDQAEEMEFSDRLAEAGETYWADFMAARWADLDETRTLLAQQQPMAMYRGYVAERAVGSLAAAMTQLQHLTPALCVNFLDAWQADLTAWERATQRMFAVRDTAEAMEFLGLDEWDETRLTDREMYAAVR